jgi:hypothetical protein
MPVSHPTHARTVGRTIARNSAARRDQPIGLALATTEAVVPGPLRAEYAHCVEHALRLAASATSWAPVSTTGGFRPGAEAMTVGDDVGTPRPRTAWRSTMTTPGE